MIIAGIAAGNSYSNLVSLNKGGGGAPANYSSIEQSFFKMQTSAHTIPTRGGNTDGALSLEQWVKIAPAPSSPTMIEIMGIEAFVAERTFVAINDTDIKLEHMTFGGTTVTATASLNSSTATWRHVVLTFEPGVELKVYVDGALLITQAVLPARTTISALPIFGINSGIYYSGLNGHELYEYNCYDDVLTLAECTALYNSGCPTDPTVLGSSTHLARNFTFGRNSSDYATWTGTIPNTIMKSFDTLGTTGGGSWMESSQGLAAGQDTRGYEAPCP